MKVLVTGYNGQLGRDVVRLLEKRGVECRGVDVEDFDLTDGAAVKSYVQDYVPDVIDLRRGERRRHAEHGSCGAERRGETGLYFHGLCVFRRGRGALDGGRAL